MPSSGVAENLPRNRKAKKRQDSANRHVGRNSHRTEGTSNGPGSTSNVVGNSSAGYLATGRPPVPVTVRLPSDYPTVSSHPDAVASAESTLNPLAKKYVPSARVSTADAGSYNSWANPTSGTTRTTTANSGTSHVADSHTRNLFAKAPDAATAPSTVLDDIQAPRSQSSITSGIPVAQPTRVVDSALPTDGMPDIRLECSSEHPSVYPDGGVQDYTVGSGSVLFNIVCDARYRHLSPEELRIRDLGLEFHPADPYGHQSFEETRWGHYAETGRSFPSSLEGPSSHGTPAFPSHVNPASFAPPGSTVHAPQSDQTTLSGEFGNDKQIPSKRG
ncbi:hypothetical protein BC834DRAFT_900547 [Gloeopeniophorella convolvens]|nr:hypothetical protein BC834DRAFT_900547 [Gloeopeniophorella convolvens]